MKAKIYAINSDLIPTYEKEGDAGFDLRANIGSTQTIQPGERAVIGTGVFVALEPGTEIQIRPRSGLAAKHGVTVLNAPGTIDSNYRGEIGVILYNSDKRNPFTVERNMRIAQGVLAKVETVEWELVEAREELGETNRGAAGFGSTGSN